MKIFLMFMVILITGVLFLSKGNTLGFEWAPAESPELSCSRPIGEGLHCDPGRDINLVGNTYNRINPLLLNSSRGNQMGREPIYKKGFSVMPIPNQRLPDRVA